MNTPAPHQHPAPEVTCRTARPEELPRNATRLLERATVAGWRGLATYAKGHTLDAQGLPGRVVEAVVVRLASCVGAPADRIVGVWHDGGFAYGYLFGANRPDGPLKVGHQALAAAVVEVSRLETSLPKSSPSAVDASPLRLRSSAVDADPDLTHASTEEPA